MILWVWFFLCCTVWLQPNSRKILTTRIISLSHHNGLAFSTPSNPMQQEKCCSLQLNFWTNVWPKTYGFYVPRHEGGYWEDGQMLTWCASSGHWYDFFLPRHASCSKNNGIKCETFSFLAGLTVNKNLISTSLDTPLWWKYTNLCGPHNSISLQSYGQSCPHKPHNMMLLWCMVLHTKNTSIYFLTYKDHSN